MSARATTRPAVAPSPNFQTADDVIAAPRPDEVIEGVAWAGCVTVLASESGTGKTFLLLDLAAAVSDGLRWHGRDVRQGSVAYLSYEGDALGLRLRAIHSTHGRRLAHLYILRASDPLSPRQPRDGGEERSVGELAATAALGALSSRLIATGQPPVRLAVIDTVRASLAGSEDSSEHVAAYLRAIRRLMALLPEAAVILAHHAGWQDGEQARKRERGSSAWRGNADATLYLSADPYDRARGEAELVLRSLKTRDAEPPPPLHMIRRRVELNEKAGDDLRRGPLTSCVIVPDRRTRAERENEQARTIEAATQAQDLQVLRVLADRPDLATSVDRLRVACGLRALDVRQSIARLITDRYVEPPERQRQPYTVTAIGRTALDRGAAT